MKPGKYKNFIIKKLQHLTKNAVHNNTTEIVFAKGLISFVLAKCKARNLNLLFGNLGYHFYAERYIEYDEFLSTTAVKIISKI